MRRWSLFSALPFLGLAIVLLSAPSAWAGPKYKVLHSFGAGNDGYAPEAPVAVDARGNIYGTTLVGGAYGLGTVFELVRGRGGWAEHVLHSFCYTCGDGYWPQAALTLDALGNLYGTTVRGGTYDYGIAFELSPEPDGWTETVIHSFCSGGSHGDDGCQPYSNLIFDAAGDLYGTTGGGGPSYDGTAYELSPGSAGWSEATICGFKGGGDGRAPFAGLTWDKSGNLYGTTSEGGAYGEGTVYELARTSGDAWEERILYSFGANRYDGTDPVTAVVFDTAGNLYGATPVGGHNLCFSYYDCGTVYKLTPDGHGGWKETRIHDFAQNADGFNPNGIAIDAVGNLYGTTWDGGSGGGVVFKLAPLPHGKWKYTVLHTFSGPDGGVPEAGVTLDGKGHIYGTTFAGGAYGNGVVFELTP